MQLLPGLFFRAVKFIICKNDLNLFLDFEYRIIGINNSGYYSVVYFIKDKRNGNIYALKNCAMSFLTCIILWKANIILFYL